METIDGNSNAVSGADEVRVIRAGTEHLDVLTPLFDAYRQFYGQPPALEAAREFLSDRLAREQSVIFVAFDAGENGLGFTQLYPSFTSVHLKPLWILNDLYVAPEGRRRGVARALVKRARQHAGETGARGLELQTGRDNAPAQTLYRGLGWEEETEYLRFFLNVD